jgi:hypothetical protein
MKKDRDIQSWGSGNILSFGIVFFLDHAISQL